MNILIVGAGQVGAALGAAWLDCGHDVRFQVKDRDDPRHADLARERLQVEASPRAGDIVVLAVPYTEAHAALDALGDLSDTILIDCTNPLRMGSDGLQLSLGFHTSGAEEIARHAKTARVFKTLNQTGAENLTKGRAFHPTPMMFVAGDDVAGKSIVSGLVADLGFEPIDAGPLSSARLLEPLAMLWIELATKRGHPRGFAFAKVKSAGAVV